MDGLVQPNPPEPVHLHNSNGRPDVEKRPASTSRPGGPKPPRGANPVAGPWNLARAPAQQRYGRQVRVN